MALLPLVITRAAHQAGPWLNALKAADLAGADPVLLPLIDIVPRQPVQWLDASAGLEDSSAASAPESGQVIRFWQNWPGADNSGAGSEVVLVFVSANAVACFWDAQALRPAERAGWPQGAIACATGPATAQALRERGVPESALWCPSTARAGDSEDLWAHLQQQRPAPWWRGRFVLIVRGTGGRPWLGQQLIRAGAGLCYAQAYSVSEPVWTPDQHQQMQRVAGQPGSVWWLASAAALQTLAPRLTRAGLQAPRVLSQSQAWVLHPRQSEAATRLGFGRVHLVADARPATLRNAWQDSLRATGSPSFS